MMLAVVGTCCGAMAPAAVCCGAACEAMPEALAATAAAGLLD